MDAIFVKDKTTDKMLVLTGSEDGRINGWDLNSQKLVVKHDLDRSVVDDKHMLVSSMDFDARTDLVAACGNYNGLYLQKLESLN